VTQQLWRFTGDVVSGDTPQTVTFAFDATDGQDIMIPDLTDVAERRTFANRIKGLAALGVLRGLQTNFCNTLLVELSEDDGATWRTIIDDRALYAGPPPVDPGPLTAEDVTGLRALAHRYDDDPDPSTRAFLVLVATKIAATMGR
jgi:hypothetical protein